MKPVFTIQKKNNKKRLGKFNRELVIRLVIRRQIKPVSAHLVLCKRRSSASSRYSKLGYFNMDSSNKSLNVFGINRKKFKDAIALGASIHVSVYKMLLN
jgi:hypothetical protein